MSQILLSILFQSPEKQLCTDQVTVTFRQGKQVKVFVHKQKLMTAEVDMEDFLGNFSSIFYFKLHYVNIAK